jgi:dimethylamine monooxygenase subunit B
MSKQARISLRVRECEFISPQLRRISFEAADGGILPTAGPGAHVVFSLAGPQRLWRNAYSVANESADRKALTIIVRRVPESRGGSHFMHDHVDVGQVIEATVPTNLFPLSNIARKHLMVSGGIGITPFLSYLDTLKHMDVAWELHHLCRDVEVPIFASLFRGFDSNRIHIHPESTPPDLDGLLARQALGTHLYTCGPEGMMNWVLGRAEVAGWPRSKLHHESFGGGVVAGGRPFRVRLERSELDIDVRGDQTLLEAIEAAGVDAPCLCRGGACGQCRTTLLAGQPEHRDHFLTEAEKQANESIMICVSRAQGEHLVLDL